MRGDGRASVTPGLLARHTPRGSAQGRAAALIDIAQDLLLRHLVAEGVFEILAFKGGTALRKTYAGNAGRFSTDLDFSLRRADDDRHGAQKLLVDAIDGYSVDGFSYRVETRRGRPNVLYDTPFGAPGNLTTKLDVGPPVWLETTERPWAPLPIHRAYDLPDSIPVMSLEENVAEKIARLNRVTPARDVYDLVWIATTSPHSQFNRALVRRLAILKCWVDTHGLHAPHAEWAGPPGAAVFDPDRWLRMRAAREFDDESIGVLATPAPDLNTLATDLCAQFAFLRELDEDDREALSAGGGRRDIPIRHIQSLDGGTLDGVQLW